MFPPVSEAAVLIPIVVGLAVADCVAVVVPRRSGVVHAEVTRRSMLAQAATWVVCVGVAVYITVSGAVPGRAEWPLPVGLALGGVAVGCALVATVRSTRRDVERASVVRSLLEEAEPLPSCLDPDDEHAQVARVQLMTSRDRAGRREGTAAMRDLHGALISLRTAMEASPGTVPPVDGCAAVHRLVEITARHLGTSTGDAGYRARFQVR